MTTLEERLKELDRRVARLELEVFTKGKRVPKTEPTQERRQLRLEDVGIPTEILSSLRTNIRKVSYWDLILMLLYFAPDSLTYSDMMKLSAELKKPVSYDWLNTEFHRKKYSGLVRSEPVPGSVERAYKPNEPGRRRVEAFMSKLRAEGSPHTS